MEQYEHLPTNVLIELLGSPDLTLSFEDEITYELYRRYQADQDLTS